MFPFEGARRTFEETKRWYGLYDAADRIEWITGPGGHGALTPVHPKILAFFLKHLKGSSAEPVYSRLTPDKPQDLWCTPEGQVGGVSISEVIRRRAAEVKTPGGAKDFRTAAGITMEAERPPMQELDAPEEREPYRVFHMEVAGLDAVLAVPDGGKALPGVLLIGASEYPSEVDALAKSGHIVLVLPPRPWPAGTESAKAPIQGSYYLLSLRAEITGQTLVGLRANDIIAAVNRLTGLPSITAYASGPSGVALLHAAAIDKRITTVIVEDSLASFRMIATAPLHRNAAESMVPGALRQYDIPDLIRAIAPRKVEFRNPVDETGEHVKETFQAGSALAELAK
jgi:hypothetical protein